VKSYRDFVNSLGGAPVVWVNQLQSEIALSPMKAWSTAICALSQTRNLLQELEDKRHVARNTKWQAQLNGKISRLLSSW